MPITLYEHPDLTGRSVSHNNDRIYKGPAFHVKLVHVEMHEYWYLRDHNGQKQGPFFDGNHPVDCYVSLVIPIGMRENASHLLSIEHNSYDFDSSIKMGLSSEEK